MTTTPPEDLTVRLRPVAWRWRYCHPGRPMWKHCGKPRASYPAEPGFVAVEAEPLYREADVLAMRNEAADRIEQQAEVIGKLRDDLAWERAQSDVFRQQLGFPRAALNKDPSNGL